jgi:hypothetical protein
VPEWMLQFGVTVQHYKKVSSPSENSNAVFY